MRILAALVVLAAFAVGATAHASSPSGTCSADQTRVTLTELRYDREPTLLHYSLVATNTGSQCAVMGEPTGVLLSKTKTVLSTHVAKPAGSPLYIVLPPGNAVVSSLLVSRIAAKGEPKKACEPVAYWFRMRALNGHGSIDVPMKPPARACRYGRLDFTFFGPKS